jgi:hypothetical protein
MTITSRKVSEIEGLEDYEDYFVTIKGEVYSSKYNKIRKLKPSYLTTKGSYQIVRLCDGKGKVKNFYIHRLVAQLFLINVNESWAVEHINGNLEDNSVENLRWMGRKISKDSDELDTDKIYLGKEISDYIKLVHHASVHKGIPVPGKLEFFHGVINQALEDYVNRFGLKKTMYLLENS